MTGFLGFRACNLLRNFVLIELSFCFDWVSLQDCTFVRTTVLHVNYHSLWVNEGCTVHRSQAIFLRENA